MWCLFFFFIKFTQETTQNLARHDNATSERVTAGFLRWSSIE